MLKIPQPKMNTLLEKTSILAETRAGYRIIKGNKGIFSLLWIGAFFGFIFMPINALFPLMSMDYFGGTTTNASLVEIAFAVGMLMGGVILSIWGGFRKRIISIITSFFLMGSALTVSGLLSGNGFVIFVLCSAIMGFSAPLYSGIQMAVIQEKIQPEYLGRVFGLLGSIMSLTMPLGLFLSGMLADQIGINRWFFLSGICILTLALCSSFLPSLKSLDK